MKDSSCYIIVGHYGSGKTETSNNLALRFASEGHETAIADIDIVNPYFRTRESKSELNAAGIVVYSSNLDANPYEDTPALAVEVASCFLNTSRKNIVDVGGDAAGATILSRYGQYVPEGYELWLVVNANRYQTATVEAALGYMREIEAASGLSVTGFVNDTHCCSETTIDDVAAGERVVGELTELTGVPEALLCCESRFAGQARALWSDRELLELRLLHRPGWMSCL